jgi:hypothetical protein
LFWHAGAGEDNYLRFDRYKQQKEILGDEAKEIENKIRENINLLWDKALGK